MTTQLQKFRFDNSGIGDVLAHNRLVVPLNQREYSWEEEHVRDLFSDFADAIATDQGTYFLGTIVLTSGDEGLPEVTDGQQRLATTMILLAAIRDYFYQQGDSKRAGAIEADYLTTTDVKTTEREPRLRLNVDDNEFFTKRVLAPPDAPERSIPATRGSHRLILQATEIAAAHIRLILEPFKEAVRNDRLFEWIDFIKEGAQVIVLRVPDQLNAFTMFETLNDRGLKASQADLIKNYLLQRSGTRVSEAQSKWASMVGVLESLSSDDITVTFLHHLMITKDGPTKEREILDKIHRSVNSESLALEFLDELAESVNDYAALFNPDHSKWNKHGTSTRKHISTINTELRVQQIRPLMFSVARHFPAKEVREAFKLFVIWSVRFLIVGGRGGLLDRNYALRAQEVGTGKVTTAAQLAAAMADVVPSDVAFEGGFAVARVSQVYLARYYLRALETKRKGGTNPELMPLDDEQVINLEHVLPENPEEHWPDLDSETIAAYWKRIGNMVILQAKKNSLIGNNPFSEKKPVLASSAFLLTQEVGKETAWGTNEIVERQKRLAALAVETWPLKA